jgi:hypothetical protein
MVMATSIDYLISAQHENGGWGYATKQKPVVEPTAAVLLAIRNEPLASDSFQRGISWLLSCQHQDGGWGINKDDLESGWQTAWALLAMRYSNQNQESISKSLEWLSTVGTLDITLEEFQKPEIPKRDNIGAFIWPWLPGQAGWIEPTAMAVLALEGMTKSQLADFRISAALNYFRQYRSADGGWNIGNATALDTVVIPRAYPTTLVLMALSRIAQSEIKSIDLVALHQDMQRDPSILIQSSGLLGLRTMGEDEEALISNITKNQLPNGSWENNPFFTAWASMAFRGYL